MAVKKQANLKDVLALLDNTEFTGEDRNKLISAMFKNLRAFPFESIFELNKLGAIFVNGKQLDKEEFLRFKQSVEVLQGNWAFKVFYEQIMYMAISQGIHLGHTNEQIMFSKSCVWVLTLFKEFLAKFDNGSQK